MLFLRDLLTALESVATPEMTNINKKEMMISIAKDCAFEPEGTVPKNALGVTSNMTHNVPLANSDPNICAIM